ncbi:hypothetical protein CVT26_015506, partial [Gymnopilus dilepis]
IDPYTTGLPSGKENSSPILRLQDSLSGLALEMEHLAGRNYYAEETPLGDPTLIERTAPNAPPFTSHGFIASNSDPLFAPTPSGPSSSNFALPRPPFPHNVDRNGAYIHRLRTPQTSPTANRGNYHVPRLHSQTRPHSAPHSSNPNQNFSYPPLYQHAIPHNSLPRPNFNPMQFFPPYPHPFPPVQYVYLPPHVPAPVHAPPVPASHLPPPSSKSLPVLTSIPILNSKSDFSSWDESVRMFLRHLGVFGHILDPSELRDPSKPHLAFAIQPRLSQPPTHEEITAHMRWLENENMAQYVIFGRLGTQPRQMVPPGENERSAREMYLALRRVYGMRSFTDSYALARQLSTMVCSPGGVGDYIAKWRTGLSRLVSLGYPVSVRLFVMQFIQGLPSSLHFLTLRTSLPSRLNSMADNDLVAFQQITEEVSDLETNFRNLLQPGRPSGTGRTQPRDVSSSTPQSSAPASAPAEPTSQPLAQNRAPRHQNGGVPRDRPRDVAYLADCLDSVPHDSLTLLEPPADPTNDHDVTPSLNDIPVAPVAMFVSPCALPNPDSFDLYDPCDILREPTHLGYAFVGSDEQEAIAFVALTSRFNALLDSGCTHYIINDRSLFVSLDGSQRRNIGTANCGTLQTFGTGDVSFRASYMGRVITFTLRNCLYAPDCPINLISVGALQEKGMRIHFDPPNATVLSFPNEHEHLPGFTLTASVVHRLSFLSLDFVAQSPPLPESVAFPAYPAESFARASKPTSHLWHRRFGHLGIEATHAALTKEYVQGADYSGPLTRDYCVACVVGKSPQQPYTHHAHRADTVGELLHMDLCGPWPVLSPTKDEHFASILDDRSNFAFTSGLKKRSDAYLHYKKTEAFLERASGNKVRALRVDGALELTKGVMGEHLKARGIAVQMTVPYAHPQNGKIKRYIRTLEDGALTLLAESGLPMSFWLDAVMSYQYVRNRLPTSTLPTNITPYEVISGRKPDVSHFRVWGCQCFVAIPEEIRPKGGFRRYEAIFVGYEEHRIGWRVRDLQGKYYFSWDVIFNEDSTGRLGVPRSLKPTQPSPSMPSRPTRTCIPTEAGKAYAEVLQLKADRARARAERRKLALQANATADGGASPRTSGDNTVWMTFPGNVRMTAESMTARWTSFSLSLPPRLSPTHPGCSPSWTGKRSSTGTPAWTYNPLLHSLPPHAPLSTSPNHPTLILRLLHGQMLLSGELPWSAR